MINYKLAKQLQKKGFSKIDFEHGTQGSVIILNEPTLSELIEKCEEDFEALVRATKKNGEKGFFALTKNDLWPHKVWLGDERFGKNPKEAVAKLWLKLNAKD